MKFLLWYMLIIFLLNERLCASSACLPHSWNKEKISKFDQSIKTKLNKNLLQEAIWEMSEKSMHKESDELRKFLLNLMHESTPSLSTKKVSHGTTKPIILNLKCDIKAIFKRKKNHPSSNYKFEIAAYKVDRYFSFNFVPMTIRKKFQKHIGSLQYFINNSYELNDIKLLHRKTDINIFDYIISNKDRNLKNILLVDNKSIAIDHGLAFRKSNLLGSTLVLFDKVKKKIGIKHDQLRINTKIYKNNKINYTASIIDNILNIDLKNLEKELQELLSKKNINHLKHKINKIRNHFSLNNKKV